MFSATVCLLLFSSKQSISNLDKNVELKITQILKITLEILLNSKRLVA